MPESAVAWLAEASPKEQHTIASPGSPVSIRARRASRRRAGASANAQPIAFGSCEAMVEVWGGTHSSFEPHTLWRPRAIGSSFEAQKESKVSKSGVEPGSLRARAIIRAPER